MDFLYLSTVQKVYSPTVQRDKLLNYRVAPADFQGFYELVLFDGLVNRNPSPEKSD
jgi:hypothetical protein